MTTLILVTGGTGTLGKLVVPRLREAGAKVRVLSRQAREPDGDVEFVRGDLDTGAGIDAAVAGAEVIVHCAGAQKGDGDKARALVRAASRAGTPHLVTWPAYPRDSDLDPWDTDSAADLRRHWHTVCWRSRDRRPR